MEYARQRYNLGLFHFTGHKCVEKLMTEFRYRWSYYQEGQTCLYIGHLVSFK
jgi:hypothetical protein